MPFSPFSYTARWDSAGVDCSVCFHFRGPRAWPDNGLESRCGLHNLPLDMALSPNGLREGEWFCTEFRNSGQAHQQAITELQAALPSLEPQVLYRCSGTTLLAYPFSEVRAERVNESETDSFRI
jgi:hypothetical protein